MVLSNRRSLLIIVVTIVVLSLVAAGCAASAPAPLAEEREAEERAPVGLQATPRPEQVLEAEAPADVQAQEDSQRAAATPAVFRTGADTQVGPGAGAGRLIIKNAEMQLLVSDTDVAVDRLTQILADNGGYIVSSREWFQEREDDHYKHATVTFAVPVDRFEQALSRLRGVGMRVLDEKASGEDVTDQFVDLESRVRNLEATRDRIRSFLDQADTVEEALRVNQQLTKVEEQIEQLRGRMNFLAERAAFSTVTVTFQPDIPEIEPTPTPTATATPTPVPWSASDTWQSASGTLIGAYQGLATLAIWLGVVVVPVFGPFALIGWGVWRLRQRKSSNTQGPS